MYTAQTTTKYKAKLRNKKNTNELSKCSKCCSDLNIKQHRRKKEVNIKRVPHLKPFFLFTATVRLKFMLKNVMKIIIFFPLCDFIDFLFHVQLAVFIGVDQHGNWIF